MKKKTIFLILTISLFTLCQTKTVKATSATFYESDYIPNIWMNKKNPNDALIYYNQARFFKETSTNNIAYCIEPFIFFNQNNSYIETETPNNYTQEQITNMTLISHFGYGYENHTEPKWYAITQMMLWKIAEPNGYYYFSEYKNGPEVNMFEDEINELNNLVENYKKNISFNNQVFTIVKNSIFSKTDLNNVISNYETSSDNATIENNTLTIKDLPIGTHTITFTRKSTLYNRPILFYQSDTNQDILETGDPLPNENTITIKVINTTVKVYKYDKGTVGPTPQGDASLAGAVFALYTQNHQYIKDIIIEETTPTIIENLDFGTYYLKEKTPGAGYKLNKNNFYFTISTTQTTTKVTIFNEVIKGKLQLKKEYGYANNFQPEENISFNIYDKNDNLIKTITTNSEGIAEITLPYGKYKLLQLTTTEGYQKIEPITFEIATEETIYYNLKNYKIEVPNTKTKSLFQQILDFLKELLCGKK